MALRVGLNLAGEVRSGGRVEDDRRERQGRREFADAHGPVEDPGVVDPTRRAIPSSSGRVPAARSCWVWLCGSGSTWPARSGAEVGSRMTAANARAVVSLPTPTGPWKTQAWWIRPDWIEVRSAATARSCPMIPERGSGRGVARISERFRGLI